ncbi:hypothetical protein JCM33374_g3506 [Metschnikowia sp. JCM 33374]|nr:hypothetical protein JCM33374_g3506 [Metschnikowia sp. JCM 33374]
MMATIFLTAINMLHVMFGVAHGLHPEPPVKRSISALPIKLDFTVQQISSNYIPIENLATSDNVSDSDINKRNMLCEQIYKYHDLAYITTIYLGSQKQSVTVSIDTGSADLWVPGISYDPQLSSLSYYTGQSFDVGYLGGENLHGTYFLDRFQFGSESSVLPSFQFARADSSRLGVLGLGDTSLLASQTPYDNLPWALYNAGIISKPAYSLFMNPENGTGALIMGGIDTEKYSGELFGYMASTTNDGLGINLKAMTFNGKHSVINELVYLDSGTSFGLLSRNVMKELDVAFDTTVWTFNGVEYRGTSCDQPADKSIDFEFGHNTISITYADAIIRKPDGTCLLGFGYYNGKYVLGNVFLKKAYVYYDLMEKSISFAQVASSNSSNIINR